MVNGTPGKMGISVSEAVLNREGVNFLPYSLTGENSSVETVDIGETKV